LAYLFVDTVYIWSWLHYRSSEVSK